MRGMTTCWHLWALLAACSGLVSLSYAAGTYKVTADIKTRGSPTEKFGKLLKTIERNALSPAAAAAAPKSSLQDILAEAQQLLKELPGARLYRYYDVTRMRALRNTGGNVTRREQEALEYTDKPVHPAARAFMRNLARYLRRRDVTQVLLLNTSGVPRVFMEPPEDRQKMCFDAKQADDMSKEGRECVCDFSRPWSECNSILYDEGSEVFEENFQQAENDPAAPFVDDTQLAFQDLGRRLREQVAAQQLGSQLDANLKAGCRIRFKKADFPAGCIKFGCSVPIPPVPLIKFTVDINGCVDYISWAEAETALQVCGPESPFCLNITSSNWEEVAVTRLIQAAEGTYISIFAGLCVDVKAKGFPFRKILKWIGVKKICVSGITATWYPSKEQFTLVNEAGIVILTFGWEGTLQYSDGKEIEFCRGTRELDAKYGYNIYGDPSKNLPPEGYYNWMLKCKNYCAWSTKPDYTGQFNLFFGLDFFFWAEKWSWTVFGSPDPEPCTEMPEPCPKGQYFNMTTRACTNCPPGSWQDKLRSTRCNLCAPGTYNVLEGSFVNAACLPCPPGTHNPDAGARNPLQCVPCPAGKFNEDWGQASCSDCQPGTWSSKIGQRSRSTCNYCPTKTNSTALGATSIDTCKPCPTGTYNNVVGQEFCFNCPPGQFQDKTGQDKCKPCEPGTATDKEGTVECPLCSPGYAQPQNGSKTCNACTPGYYQSKRGQTSCTRCEYGTVSNDFARTQPCNICPAGTYAKCMGYDCFCMTCAYIWPYPKPKEVACLNCPNGTVSRVGQTEPCQACKPGTYRFPYPQGTQPPPGDTGCRGCPAGTYIPNEAGEGVEACLRCPTGQTSMEGSVKCTGCPGGSSANKYPNSTEAAAGCYLCPAGLFAPPAGGALRCRRCPNGTSTGGRQGWDHCDNCSPETYAPGRGTPACLPCPPGTNTTVPGVGPRSKCVQCAPGWFNDKPAGGCRVCPAGTYSNANNTGCLPCEPGSFGSAPGQAKCQLCAPGSYAEAPGQTECKLCGAGSWNGLAGQSSCTLCSAGSASPDVGRVTSCPLCPGGQYQDKQGQPSCQKCAKGKYFSGAGATSSTSCISCRPGTASNEEGRAAPCPPCPPGQFQPSAGKSQCSCCGQNEFQDEEGQTKCKPCSVPGRKGTCYKTCP